MPSPGRRNTPPPPHIGSGSSSYRRQRSPDRRRKMEPTSRSAGSSRNVSPPLRSRRPPEHTSRPPPESRSRPRLSQPSVLPPGRNRSPVQTDTNGRSFSAAHSAKRKASPKREREVVREHLPSERSRPTPRKMMRSVSPAGPPPPRDIPLLAPARPSPPPPSRGYARHSPPPARSYTAKPSLPPAPRGYTDVSVTLVSDSRSYSSMAAGVGKPSTLSRQYVGSSSTMIRRSPSEERAFVPRTSAQKRATAHMTSNRFSDIHGEDEDLLTRRSESINLKPGLTDFVFNVNNEPKTKFSRDAHGVVRKITSPESLQVVRRPAPQSRDAPKYNKINNSNGYDSEEEDLYRPRPMWTNPREGARPIFDRDEIKRPSRDDDLLDRPPVQQVARFVSSGPYLDAPRDSRNGQPPSRPIASHSRDTHSRDIHSRDIHSRDIPSHSRDIPSHSRDIPSRSRDVHEAPQHHSSSRAGPARDSYYEQEERREYRQRGFEEEEPRGRHDNGSHRSARRDDRDDLRHELELRRDPAARHSPERGARGRDVRGESDSDLRVRINEKRSTRSTDRVFRERADERGGRPHEHSSRPHERERRRSASGERRRDSYERKPPPGGGRSAGQQGAYRDRSPPPPAASSSRYHHEEREEYHEQPMLPWVPDPEHVPRGNAYFEHDNREEGMVMVRGRGGYMHMRGFMGRGMRRPYRGSPMNRGGYVMLGRGPRRGFGPPRGQPRRSSPQWEHDMFDKLGAEPDDK